MQIKMIWTSIIFQNYDWTPLLPRNKVVQNVFKDTTWRCYLNMVLSDVFLLQFLTRNVIRVVSNCIYVLLFCGIATKMCFCAAKPHVQRQLRHSRNPQNTFKNTLWYNSTEISEEWNTRDRISNHKWYVYEVFWCLYSDKNQDWLSVAILALNKLTLLMPYLYLQWRN